MTFKTLQTNFLPPFESALSSAIEFDINNDDRQILIDAIKHSVSAPGKRIRPLICMAVENSIKNTVKVSIPIGVSIELIHCYSLIHDDLPAMDNDDYRRGIPTCHKAFGEDIAILSGDTLNTYAFEYLITKLKPYISADKILEITRLFSIACGINGMAGGQVLDLKSSSITNNSIEKLKQIHALKTGALFESCFHLTALAVSEDKDLVNTYKMIGKHFGLLFQIIDDILDETSTLAELGKSPGKDIEQNKLTFVSELGIEGARKYALDERNKAITLLNSLPFPANELISIIDFIHEKGATNA